ncbi:MAG: MotA/TolQ/ExbB proton channel family protein [Bacteroidetes bacterium]|nr:MotA/TolQ/ExbB proton channel family protein [Bacteroidota bacterium]
MSTEEDGSYTYPNGSSFSLRITEDSIYVKQNNTDSIYNLAKTTRFILPVKIIFGYRTINTATGELESSTLNLGAKLQKLDKDNSIDKDKKGIRWMQAVIQTVKTNSRLSTFFNGFIQWFIYFFSMIIIVFVIIDFGFLNKNSKLLNKNDFLKSETLTVEKNELEKLLQETKQELNQSEGHPELEPNIFLNIYQHSLSSLLSFNNSEINKGELVANLEAYGQGFQERIERRFQILKYFLNAIPSLGFIGTVMGISEALTITSKLTGESLPYERMVANDTLSQSLNFAFDTTLVGLFASILLSLFSDWLENREVSFVVEVRQRILSRLLLIQELK